MYKRQKGFLFVNNWIPPNLQRQVVLFRQISTLDSRRMLNLWIVQCLIFTSLGHIKPYIKNLLEYKCVSHLTTIGVSIFFLKFRWKLAIRLDVVDSTTRQPGYNNWPFKGNLYVK